MLRAAKTVSSTCTGAYTSEMALAVIQKTVNDSAVLPTTIGFRSVAAYVLHSEHSKRFCRTQITGAESRSLNFCSMVANFLCYTMYVA